MHPTLWNSYADVAEKDEAPMLCYTCWRKAGNTDLDAKEQVDQKYASAVAALTFNVALVDPETCTFRDVLPAAEVDEFVRKWRPVASCAMPDCDKYPGLRCSCNAMALSGAPNFRNCQTGTVQNGLALTPRVCDLHAVHVFPCESAPKPKAREHTLARHEANKAFREEYRAARQALDERRKAAAIRHNEVEKVRWFERERANIAAALALAPPRSS